jgi:hypothetical protein
MKKDKLKLNWKSEIFSSTIIVFDKNKKIGFFKSELFSDNTSLKINKTKYNFFKKDIFSQKILIFNTSTKEIIGEINYESFKTKAQIKLNDKSYSWKYENFWNNKWSLTDENGILSEYDSNFNGGQIESITNDYLLILTGLFTTNYYLKMITFFIVCILIPLLASR